VLTKRPTTNNLLKYCGKHQTFKKLIPLIRPYKNQWVDYKRNRYCKQLQHKKNHNNIYLTSTLKHIKVQ
jgi:hypothetical protein